MRKDKSTRPLDANYPNCFRAKAEREWRTMYTTGQDKMILDLCVEQQQQQQQSRQSAAVRHEGPHLDKILHLVGVLNHFLPDSAAAFYPAGAYRQTDK